MLLSLTVFLSLCYDIIIDRMFIMGDCCGAGVWAWYGMGKRAYGFRRYTPALRYAANVSQRRYGICSFAALVETWRKDRIIHCTSPHSRASQSSAPPKHCMRKKNMGQRKLTASCQRNSCRLLSRCCDGSDRAIFAAPTPIIAYRIVQTMGNSMAGGESGGFSMTSRYSSTLSRMSQPERAPVASAMMIQNK